MRVVNSVRKRMFKFLLQTDSYSEFDFTFQGEVMYIVKKESNEANLHLRKPFSASIVQFKNSTRVSTQERKNHFENMYGSIYL